MAAPTIDAIMQAVAVRLRTISSLSGRVYPYLPDQINSPMAYIEAPHTVGYHSTFGNGKVEYAMKVVVIVSDVVDRAAMINITKYADPTGANSVISAIEGDRTLAGTVDDCTVGTGLRKGNGFTMMTNEQVTGLGFFGGTFELFIIANGV